MIEAPCPLLGFVGYSGSGKTTLLTQLIALLRERGYQLGVIKHAHHQFDIDYPGKDSYELRHAGASQMLVASQNRWALITETPLQNHDPQLEELIPKLDCDGLDLILVEGFKHAAYTKLEVYRDVVSHSPLYVDDPQIIALITELPTDIDAGLSLLDINNPPAIADFVEAFIQQNRG
ncbi:MAG: molybdopterin-guanine dinucleotide biosynthesis protein B [Thiohalophilus sp.]|uniref:molybdopterin-guanine dinucleotide biosynthesis protein B n=1 Tax=Thiohalophilus sp. TaxID=3028392 RepID=UPI0028705CAA|nr:molybdopterin-guanine dinucleotide biosynthesis protein B [Thiohalophilus sp.]MDR9436819.1 molybdopterin-guanine dinucleotide biosynthesis protein B [Thiohalophilus sp.]